MLLKTFIIGLIVYPIFSINPLYAISPELTKEEIISQMSVHELVAHFANEYSVSESQILGTINCESSFVAQQSRIINKYGQREESYGIVQIHLPDHPHITKEQAMDNIFSAEFIAKEFSKGKQTKWSCWKKLYL
jgi:hypothetical protein